MVQVPYTPYPTKESADLPTHSVQIHTDQSAFTAVGRALSNVGVDLGRVADTFWDVEKRNQDLQADKALTDYEIDTDKKTLEFGLKPGNEQFDGLEGHLKDLQDSRDKIASTMSPYQRQRFLNESRGVFTRNAGRATGRAITTMKDYEKKELNSTIDLTVDDMINNMDDPAAVERGLKKIGELDGRESNADGLPSGAAGMKVKERYGQVANKVVTTILNKYRDPEKAQKFLDRLKGAIRPEIYYELTGKIKDEKDKIDGRTFTRGVINEQNKAPGSGANPAHDPITGAPVGPKTAPTEPGKPGTDKRSKLMQETDPEALAFASSEEAGTDLLQYSESFYASLPPAATPTGYHGRGSEDAPPTSAAARKPQARAVIGDVASIWSKHGMSAHGVRGVLANIEEESRFDPHLRHADQPKFTGEAHYAHGLYQEGGEEWNKYARWLKQNHPGADWRDHKLQSEFAAINLKQNYPRTWQKMVNARSPAEAAAIYVREYLKPKKEYQASRIAKFMRRGIPDYGT